MLYNRQSKPSKSTCSLCGHFLPVAETRWCPLLDLPHARLDRQELKIKHMRVPPPRSSIAPSAFTYSTLHFIFCNYVVPGHVRLNQLFLTSWGSSSCIGFCRAEHMRPT
ncbi:hypothetical protein HRR83_006973 [Exophiala dermatitidis]|uniref:Uncharacterized protein n=1 Tax=Exophiala dermatitidis TaxID=5970 RepID=A0AAN6EQB0_EXODE|nr:hypothetical protein HRR73_006012 [Exophiala dermatitidis]KAJ4570309.1 hypothetical protein HRR82_007513 [Exophiala dermatitidis]KAJ4579946.1 hypothetical protein HRR81_002109 [Exophiala dermatitidis]KAJ4592415.1 hypothetical protein HRR83_006973 [Exophiala dermatitidis]KAJ4621903.1 hypothetical protein HRR86_006229 [Exophiala dermatitidis]